MFPPDVFFPVLQRVAGILDACGIRYHLTGGLVAVYYAEPRLTQDADLVVDPEQLRQHLDEFLDAIRQLNYVANPAAIRDAIRRGKMFQVFDPQACLKIDFYPRELAPGALTRSVWVELSAGLRFPIASRPDVIVSKLVWINKGSHKSRRDVRQLMLRASADEVRLTREFAASLGLTHLLEEVLAESDEIDG